VPANMFTPQEHIVFKDLIQQYRTNPGRRTILKNRHPDVNWSLLTINFQASMRNALSTSQTLDVAHLMDAWTDLARELVHIANKAREAVESSIAETSATHAARLGFLARATWLILTTAAPPPFGALVGAVIRGVCGEESWDKVIDRTYEWVMQAPFPHASNTTDGRVSLAHVITSGEATRSARIQYIGGHPALRELKDFNQVLQKVGSIPNPTISGNIKVWEKKYLPVNLLKLKPPSKATGHLMANQVHLECRDKAKALVSAVESALAEYSDDRDTAESVVCAAYNWVFEYNKPNPKVAFVVNMFEPSHPLAPSQAAPVSKRDKKNEIVSTLDAFRNTFAADLVHELRSTLRAQPVGIINRDDAQVEFERVFIAHYLRAVTEAPTGGVASSAQGDPEHWANVVGTVPSNVVSSHLEVKMQTLGIINKIGLFSAAKVTRGEIYETASRVWIPPDTTNFMPVPFKTGEVWTRGARGRLAAWAHDYIDRVPVDDVFKSIYKALRSVR
jgi:hypothetical protein